jgi:hypothetical protein
MQQFGPLDEIKAPKNCIPRTPPRENGDTSNSNLAETSLLNVGMLVHNTIIMISKK